MTLSTAAIGDHAMTAAEKRRQRFRRAQRNSARWASTFATNGGALLLALLVVGASALIVLPLQLDPDGQVERIVFTVFSWVPLAFLSWVMAENYAVVSYNLRRADDSRIRVVPLLVSFMLWVTSWALIFMLFWTWDRLGSWTDVTGARGAYEMWVRFASVTLTMAVGVGFTTHVPTSTLAQVVGGGMTFAAVMLDLYVVGIALGLFHGLLDERKYDNGDNGDNNNNNNNNNDSRVGASYGDGPGSQLLPRRSQPHIVMDL